MTRFFNEARAATAVKHPGIVEIYDFGYHTDGSAYIVMEYLEGESLSARLRRFGPLPATRAAALGRQVAGALGAAHAKGIIHRDLKPDNIFIVRDPDIADGELPPHMLAELHEVVANPRTEDVSTAVQRAWQTGRRSWIELAQRHGRAAPQQLFTEIDYALSRRRMPPIGNPP